MLIKIGSSQDYHNFVKTYPKGILLIHRGIFPLYLATTELIKNKYGQTKDLVFGRLDSLSEPGITQEKGLFVVIYLSDGSRVPIPAHLKPDQALAMIMAHTNKDI